MSNKFVLFFIAFIFISSCKKEPQDNNSTEILGYQLLSELRGHWIGSNETAFGNFDWFAFDFRPISENHIHSIYEGATNSNIITSLFIADFEGKQQIFARNGGQLSSVYRATYFVLDQANITNNSSYYRLVDAVGGEKRAFIEFEFKNDKMFFNAYKDNSGNLDEPIIHMAFEGINENPEYVVDAIKLFNFPQEVSEIDLNGKFVNLVDPDSALFFDESLDPLPRAAHGHVSELEISITRGVEAEDKKMLLYISTEPLIDAQGAVNLTNVNKHVVRTIDIFPLEDSYTASYLHPDEYFVTMFVDEDENLFPSTGDICNPSKMVDVTPESFIFTEVKVDLVVL